MSLVVLPDGSLASGSADNTTRIWDTKSGETIKILTGHTAGVCSLVFLPDGLLASGSWDKTIRIWNTKSGETIKILTGHTAGVWSLVVLPDGLLASGSYDSTIRIWNKFPKLSQTLLLLLDNNLLIRIKMKLIHLCLMNSNDTLYKFNLA